MISFSACIDSMTLFEFSKIKWADILIWFKYIKFGNGSFTLNIAQNDDDEEEEVEDKGGG